MIDLIPKFEVFGEQWELTHLFQQYVDIDESRMRHSFYNNARTNPYIAEVKHAITERFYVGIYYEEENETDIVKSGFRLIEPFAYGIGYVHQPSGAVANTNRQYLRAYVIMDTEADAKAKMKFHTPRTSVSLTNREPFWRLFRIDRITTWFAFPKRFSRYRPLYNPGDKTMYKVMTSLDYDKFPYGEYTDEDKRRITESKMINEGLPKKHYKCIDCGTYDMYDDYFGKAFMVTNDIWDKITASEESDKLLCWDCVEKRLGRKLTPDDFIDCPLNSWNTRLQALKKGVVAEAKLLKESADKQSIVALKNQIATVAQKVYDAWEQDEDGIDEMYGAGGICDDIADIIGDVIQANTDFTCTTLYNEYDYHTSVYAYNTDKKICYHIDINPFNYETGAAYTWKKIPDVVFDESMVEIDQVSYEDYVNDEGEWINEGKKHDINESFDITKILEDLPNNEEFKDCAVSPDINYTKAQLKYALTHDLCTDVAYYLKQKYPNENIQPIFVLVTHGEYYHVCIKYNGKYYDGEDINGVNSILDLSFFKENDINNMSEIQIDDEGAEGKLGSEYTFVTDFIIGESKINETQTNNNMDIIITIPKGTSWDDYKKELVAAENGEIMNFKVTNFPTKASVGSKCYVVYDGKVMGYMLISGMSEKSFVCSTTGKHWDGKFIERSGKFYPTDPVEMPGFRGFRYYSSN